MSSFPHIPRPGLPQQPPVTAPPSPLHETVGRPPMPPQPLSEEIPAPEVLDAAAIESLFDDDEITVPSNTWGSRLDNDTPAQEHHRAVDVEVYETASQEQSDAQVHQTLLTLLSHPACSEIHGLGPDQLWAKVNGQSRRLKETFSDEMAYNTWIKQQVVEAESIVSWEDVKVRRHTTLQMVDGSSLTLALPPLSAYTQFTIRKHNLSSYTATDLVKNGTMTSEMMQFLGAAVYAGANTLIVGPMGAGKTSLISILTEFFKDTDRIALLEEVPEINIRKKHVSPFIYLPQEEGLGLSDLLETLLFMRYQRVVIGEAHFEVTKMLEIMMTGADGSMATYHARSIAQAVERLRLGLQFEHPNLNEQTATKLIRDAIELVVVVGVRGGKHRVLEIGEVDWRQSQGGGGLSIRTLWKWDNAANRHVVVHPLDADDRIAIKASEQEGVTINWDWWLTDLSRQ